MSHLNISVSTQAVEQLNIKTKSFKDLLTDEPFTRKDIITLQVGCCLIFALQGSKNNLMVFFLFIIIIFFVFEGPYKPR